MSVTPIRLITPNRVLTETDGLSIHSVRISFDGPRTLSFGHDIRFDEGLLGNGNKVSLVVKGITIFTGWIVDNDPMMGEQETIEYRAVGPRAKLATLIHVRHGSANVTYNAEDDRKGSTKDWTYGRIFQEIVSVIPNDIVAGTSGINIMDTVATETSFVTMSVDNCLRYIVEKAGKFGFYITPQRQLRVVDLSNTTNKKVHIGEIGQQVSEHSEYDVAKANLNWSVANAKTKCTIEGARERTETVIHMAPAWNPALEKYWRLNLDALSPEALALLRLPSGMLDVFRKYRMSGYSNVRIWDRLISDMVSAPQTELRGSSGAWYRIKATPDFDVDGEFVFFSKPMYLVRSVFLGLDFNDKAVWHRVRSAARTRMKCVIQGRPLIVHVGPIGTAVAKGNTNEIYIIDNSLVKENVAREGASAARDDTSKMITLATQLLEPVKDEAITGTITLDGFDMGWGLENNVDINNTKDGVWSTINAMILSVTYAFGGVTEETILQVSSNHYLGAGLDYAELKRRLIVAQKINTLTVNQALFLDTGIVTGVDPEDIIDEDLGVESIEEMADRLQEVIELVVQAGFDAKTFTIQQHDHTDDKEGGAAFAEKGSALL